MRNTLYHLGAEAAPNPPLGNGGSSAHIGGLTHYYLEVPGAKSSLIPVQWRLQRMRRVMFVPQALGWETASSNAQYYLQPGRWGSPHYAIELSQ